MLRIVSLDLSPEIPFPSLYMTAGEIPQPQREQDKLEVS